MQLYRGCRTTSSYIPHPAPPAPSSPLPLPKSSCSSFARTQGHYDVVRALLDHGARMAMLTNENATALDVALQSGREGVAELLRGRCQRYSLVLQEDGLVFRCADNATRSLFLHLSQWNLSRLSLSFSPPSPLPIGLSLVRLSLFFLVLGMLSNENAAVVDVALPSGGREGVAELLRGRCQRYNLVLQEDGLVFRCVRDSLICP